MNKTFKPVQGEDCVSEAELELINRYSKKNLTADEVYTFSVILCDNEIDRDGERFSTDALNTLAELFKGKTGISDHSMKASDQTSRIYDTALETFPEQKTKAGEAYTRLKAKAYTPRSEKNAAFITDIEAGIKKEVSVGCSAARAVCSVCGADTRGAGCAHRNGKMYSGKLCHTVLCDPTDAYEWSFVAVPAQPAAGVVKSFGGKKNGGEKNMEEILKCFKCVPEDGVSLSKSDAEKLSKHMDSLQALAADGTAYKKSLVENALKLCACTISGLSRESAGEICKKLSVGELIEFTAALEKQAKQVLPCEPQLALSKAMTDTGSNTEFKI
ncbi:MAG: hypothetical protein GX851_08335 [Clostridiales bacterium]|nr:hypothetical protein [Clostridiales bacterium]